MTTQRPGAKIIFNQISKSFGGKAVLWAIDLMIDPGAFVVIIGRSGCGKSTLLRILCGLESASEGDFTFTAADGAIVAPRIMFQEHRLLPWARVLDNVKVGLSGQDGDETPALEALEAVGLGARARDWPATLSGGQKQRVALARALVSRPRLLALDEPLGALDALTRLEMQSLIENVWRAQKFTALLVTHDVSEAVALADRIILLEEGCVALDIDIDLPRPRQRGSVDLALLEERILAHLLRQDAKQPEYVI